MTARRLPLRFRRDEGGVAAIEFAIIAPLLVALLLGAVTLYDLFRASHIAEKATFTTADIMSRENSTSTDKIGTNRAIFVAMSRHAASDTTFRVTSIKRQGKKFTVCWSDAPSPLVKMVDATIPTPQMPLVADGDTVLLVETTVRATPLFDSVGLPAMTLANFSAIRSRTGGPIKNESVPSAPC